MRSFLSTVVLISVCGGLQAAEPDRKAVVKEAAQAVIDATLKHDPGGVVDATYGPLVTMAGGREKLISLVEAAMNLGEFVDYTVGEPGEFQSVGKLEFAVVPTTLTMRVNDRKIRSKSYLLGVSADEGETWKFVGGSGMRYEAERKMLFPGFSETLKVPPYEKPMFVD